MNVYVYRLPSLPPSFPPSLDSTHRPMYSINSVASLCSSTNNPLLYNKGRPPSLPPSRPPPREASKCLGWKACWTNPSITTVSTTELLFTEGFSNVAASKGRMR